MYYHGKGGENVVKNFLVYMCKCNFLVLGGLLDTELCPSVVKD